MTNKLAILSLILVTACAAEVGNDYEDVPAEPALTTDEVAALPDGAELEHHVDLETALAAETPIDDGSAYDNDAVEGIVDVEVTEVAQQYRLAHLGGQFADQPQGPIEIRSVDRGDGRVVVRS